MRTASGVAIAGAALWAATLVCAPLLRPDLDLVRAHPEDYATGEWAIVTQVGYGGAAIAGLGAAFVARRRPVAAMLLAVFGIGALAIGILPPTSNLGSGKSLADRIFPWLQLAPLAFMPAIAWISWRERTRTLNVLAAITWLLFLPLLGHPPNSGAINRAADLAMAAWLIAYATTSGLRPEARRTTIPA